MLPNQQNQPQNQQGLQQSWLSKAMPSISTALGAGGALLSGNSQAKALRANAGVYQAEGATAAAQGYAQEAQQRQQGARVIGEQVAAAGQAGAGYGGSTGRMIAQNARNAELDALNVRYKAQMQRWSYNTQAANLRSEATTAQAGGLLKAGAALLQGFSSSYTGKASRQALSAGNGVNPLMSGLA